MCALRCAGRCTCSSRSRLMKSGSAPLATAFISVTHHSASERCSLVPSSPKRETRCCRVASAHTAADWSSSASSSFSPLFDWHSVSPRQPVARGPARVCGRLRSTEVGSADVCRRSWTQVCTGRSAPHLPPRRGWRRCPSNWHTSASTHTQRPSATGSGAGASARR